MDNRYLFGMRSFKAEFTEQRTFFKNGKLFMGDAYVTTALRRLLFFNRRKIKKEQSGRSQGHIKCRHNGTKDCRDL